MSLASLCSQVVLIIHRKVMAAGTDYPGSWQFDATPPVTDPVGGDDFPAPTFLRAGADLVDFAPGFDGIVPELAYGDRLRLINTSGPGTFEGVVLQAMGYGGMTRFTLDRVLSADWPPAPGDFLSTEKVVTNDLTYGDDQLQWESEVETKARLHATTSSDDLVGQSTTLRRWVCSVPAPVELRREDLVRVDGVDYRLVGEPYRALRAPTGQWTHTEAVLVEVHS